MSMHDKVQYQDLKPSILPYLIAPEMLDSEIVYSEKCDIWSIGALAYLLISGMLPFDDGEDITIFEEI